MKQEEKELYAAGPLYKALTEYKKLDPATPSPLSILTTISNPVENRFRDALGNERAESEEGESMDETLSEAGEEMEMGNTPEQNPAERDFTTQELPRDLSGDDWANRATRPLGSPRKDLELPLTSETMIKDIIIPKAREGRGKSWKGRTGIKKSTQSLKRI